MINLFEAARQAGQQANGAALAAALGGSPAASPVAADNAASPAVAQALQAQALLTAYSTSQVPLGSAAQLQALLPQIPTLNSATATDPALSQRVAALLRGGNPGAPPLASPAAQAALLQQLTAARGLPTTAPPVVNAAPATAAETTPPPSVGAEAAPNKPSLPSKAKKAPSKTKGGAAKSKRKAAAAAAAVAASTASVEDMNSLHPDMSNWPVEKLEEHVNFLEQRNRPVPYTLKLLLGNAKRKEEKRQAKRIANRKFAHISRTRKKAFVQELTQQNEQLKRHSMILSLLPDVVFVIGAEGDITFCSNRAERVLRYGMEELVGRNMADLLAPTSKDKLNTLIKQLLLSDTSTAPGQQQQSVARGGDSSLSPVVSQSSGGRMEESKKELPPSKEGKKEGVFPMSVVNVKAATSTGGQDGGAASAKKDNAPPGTFVSNEDSGYSSLSTNDSREEPSSSLNESAGSFGRNQPIAPTWTICLKRKDDKEIWCEATLTVISNDQEETPNKSPKKGSLKSFSSSNRSNQGSTDTNLPMKELLLSVRPFRSSKKRSKNSRSWSRKQGDLKRPAGSMEKDGKKRKTSAAHEKIDAIAKERGHNVSPNSDMSSSEIISDKKKPQSSDEDIAKSLLLMQGHCRSSSSSSSS